MKKLIIALFVGWMLASTELVYGLSAGFYGGDHTIPCNGSADIEFRFTGQGPVDFSYTDGYGFYHVYNVSQSPYVFSVGPSITTTYELILVENSLGYGQILEGHKYVTVSVAGSGDAPTFTPPDYLCENASPIDLRNCFKPDASWIVSFQGNGVVGNIFYPQRAGVGSHYVVVNYSYNNSISSIGRTINVNSMPQVSLWLPSEVFLNESPFILSGGRPSGGTYSTDYGDNCIVNGNVFDPSKAGVGWHNVYYTYTTVNGCQDVAQSKIYVRMSGNDVEETVEDSFAVYPNPTKGVVQFSEPCSVDIFSTMCLVRRENSLVGSIDISDLPDGVYVLRLSNGENYFIRRIVKE